ncbi:MULTISPECIES: molybdopterin-dependent oxidoreductase [Gordonia]|uniref:Molybdopterin-dependent oxidoreductase n=1 Tax=Gordonia amicalis TaxID=89053 RepID=A0AAE4R0T6_9ACTN|nr:MULTISPECIES: molybdopterin-dependent oxidoreductase [Gordonia]ATD70527.1 molybdopterin-binding oxidoreductase [Gordonia sp. 1D]MCZ4577517.1 molybdopterin-dependent oxidoreductase [Gordonia amicalis]MCZ4651146.1 molybdopterin-dependent oxidoreductase [Gordonia amicalis]MDJ0451489.1 molybdopterin-dependent oxidoreductase [Gordonia amicalis]MDV6305781.1 molybdopterin-dependent oxidoreductase [Gordonia amicalis]
MTRTAPRICPLCEATCGLTLVVDSHHHPGDGGEEFVTGARGDADDVFSHGYICPKGASFPQLDNDPDRLQNPLVKRDGRFVEVGWDEALELAVERLGRVIADHGGSSVGFYLGNPSAHTIAGTLYAPLLVRALHTRNVFSAGTLDQMPKQAASGYLFGHAGTFAVPDLDRTDHLVIIGANPVVSNGSMTTAANFPGKLNALRHRGGRLTVIDPARTRTARLADTHLAPRPGTDAALLAGVVTCLLDEGLVADDLGGIGPHVQGVDELHREISDLTPERVAPYCDVPAEDIRGLARAIAASSSAAVYGRLGTTAVEFGTLGSWLIDVVNVLTGNLDRPGGVLFPMAPTAPAPRPAHPGRGFRTGRWRSRVSGHPEVAGELPAVAMAEEFETPGEGRLRALVTVAGNPVLSAPDGGRLATALDAADVVVCVDPYLNETTRHADIILPPPRPSQTPHFDAILNNLAVRATARYSPPVLPLPDGRPDEIEIVCRLILGLSGVGVDADPGLVDEQVIAATLAKEVTDPHSPVAGRDVESLVAMLPDAPGHQRRLDMMLRIGAYGDGFGAREGLTFADVLAAPHGVDLGPMRPRLLTVLRTASGKVELAPDPLIADLARLRAAVDAENPADSDPASLLLVGRRHLRSNNSWMHNLPALTGGTNRCTLQIHPDDASRLGIDGLATVRGAGGSLTVPVEITADIKPGVASMPHGWGHDDAGSRLRVAAVEPGVNVNNLNDGTRLDPLSGTAVLNGLRVEIGPA